MSAAERTMLSFVVGATRFNYRVAAIVLRDGCVLTCREDDDDYVMLPGGRVEMGESSETALRREIAEEVHATAGAARLLFTVENFFEREAQRFHELAIYYLVELPPDVPFRRGGVAFETFDEGYRLRFEWVPLAGAGLRQRNLLPPWMIDRLADLPATTQHLVLREDRR